jgi:hypothetical protein
MVAARAPAGGGYTLQLTASSSLYDVQRSAGAVSFNGIDVTMPLGDPGCVGVRRQGQAPQEAPQPQAPPLAARVIGFGM